MAVNGLENTAYSSVDVRIRMGSAAFALRSATFPKLEIKTDAPRLLGQMIADRRTVGAGELGPLKAEMLVADYREFIKRWGKHNATAIEFVVTGTFRTPGLRGAFERLVDHCRITATQEQKLDPDEKALMIELEIQGLNLWERGEDGIWKTLVKKENLTSADAQALLSF